MFKVGYIAGEFSQITYEVFLRLSQGHGECEKLVVGLFSDDLILRITNKTAPVSYEQRKQMLGAIKYVDEIIEITQDNLSKRVIYEQIHFDVCYIGTEYGTAYQSDLEWARERSVELILPETDGRISDLEALKIILDNPYKKYGIVLFGTGIYFDIYMDRMGEEKEYAPVYAVDNNKEQWGKEKRGIKIESPEKLLVEDQEGLLVIVCCKNYKPVVEQINGYHAEIDYRLLCFSNEQAAADEWAVIFEQEKSHVVKFQEILLKLLVEFDRVCTKYHLRYFLNGGSLIGAIRHHGFIPWDDDVDVIMYQEDFDELVKHAPEEWKEDGDMRLVKYTQMGNGAILDFLHRLIYMGEEYPTNAFEKVSGKADPSLLNHCWLDIYLLNKASTNKKAQKINVLLMQAVYGLAMGHRAFVDFETYKHHDWFTRFVIHVTSGVGRILPVSFISFLHEFFARRFDKKDTPYVYETNGYATKMIFDRELFGDGVRVDMCGHQIMVPEKYDRYLEEHGYHNYMQFPSANVRKPMHGVKSPDLAG